MSSLQCPATLVVARHADAEYVEKFFSDEGGTLTRAGRGQAGALAESLAMRKVAHVWSSDVARSVQTAEIVAAALGVGVTTRKTLREVACGDLLGQPFDVAKVEAVTKRWYAGDLEARFPGGESGAEVVERYRGALAEIADEHRGETVLVVTHQTAACITLPVVAGNIRPSFAEHHLLANGQSAELVIDSDDWSLVRWAGTPL